MDRGVSMANSKIGITVSEKLYVELYERGTFNSTDKTYGKIHIQLI